MLREKLHAMKVTNAAAARSTEDTAMPKSASSLRADAAEAKLARLRKQMPAAHKKKFLKFSCKIGWCTHKGKCDSVDAELEIMKRKVTAMEHEMEQMQRFSQIRNEMESKIANIEREIRRKCGGPNALELVVVMDCTGSMALWILQAKSAISSIIKSVQLDHPRAYIRVGFVAYRDFCDGAKRIQTQTLTVDTKGVHSFISSLNAFGGGDGPEDIPGGLEAALKMPFRAEAKRIVLVADAPCHGTKFHTSNMKDDMSYSREICQSPDICAQMREMAKRGIDFTIIEVVPFYTAKMVEILRKEFNSTTSRDGISRQFQSVSLSSANAAIRFGSIVSSSASSSLSASKNRSIVASPGIAVEDSGRGNCLTARLPRLLEYDEDEEKAAEEVAIAAPPAVKMLNWADVYDSPNIAAVRHSLHFSPDEHVDWKAMNLKHTQQDTTIRLTQSCFAKGAMRSAHALYDCNMEKYLVAKLYFGNAAQKVLTSKNSLQNDVKMQIVASALRRSFRCLTISRTEWISSQHVAEPYIDGEYKKYNNNNGWISDDGLNLSETAQAFSHFTWQKTYGELMVVDLQGVGCIFTDPQIHSKHGDKFGCGNLSDAGMAAFFVTHECNSVCKALQLQPVKPGANADAASAIVTAAEKWMKKAANKSMTCSCPLCGEITIVLHSDFIQAYRGGREVYCKSCVSKMKQKPRRKCSTCKKKFGYSPYWFSMKGIGVPTTCKSCEAATAENNDE